MSAKKSTKPAPKTAKTPKPAARSRAATSGAPTPIASHTHRDTRPNIPTEELRDFVREDEQKRLVLYPRNPDLDPQLVWRGKDEQDSKPGGLHVPAVPIYIQEKIHPQAIIDDFRRHAPKPAGSPVDEQPFLFDPYAAFNGLPEDFSARVDFYQHQGHWSNRLILGDSLLVMTSLAEKEGLKGRVQMVYFDPPYGIKFGSNWQVSTRKRDVKDGKAEDVVRQPEQMRAFRDTWELGIHSYLSYLRDRLTAARELLTESGSIFVQIGDENVHLVRSVLDEVFGSENAISLISCAKTTTTTGKFLPGTNDYLLWYGKDAEFTKYRSIYLEKDAGGAGASNYTRIEMPDGKRRAMTAEERAYPERLPKGSRPFRIDNLTSPRVREARTGYYAIEFNGKSFFPKVGEWKTHRDGIERLRAAERLAATEDGLYYVRFIDDFPAYPLNNTWSDTVVAGFATEKLYVVQTNPKMIERCLLMTTDPGDLVLDPTCGSGTTAYVAEQWGRRWITTDTSRVAITLARTRLMAARFPYYIPADSPEGRKLEAELAPLRGLGAAEMTGIGAQTTTIGAQAAVGAPMSAVGAPIAAATGAQTGTIGAQAGTIGAQAGTTGAQAAGIGAIAGTIGAPTGKKGATSAGSPVPPDAAAPASSTLPLGHSATLPLPSSPDIPDIRRGFVYKRVPHVTLKSIANNPDIREGMSRREIDAAIARHADTELLYDKPYEDGKRLRVTGPFTVESLSPHRTISFEQRRTQSTRGERDDAGVNRTLKVIGPDDFGRLVLDNLKRAGVQNTFKGEKMVFESLDPHPGEWIQAVGTYTDKGGKAVRVAVCIGPEHGTVGPELVKEAAKEAVKGVGFDTLLVAGFAFDPHVSEEAKRYGKLTVLTVRINSDIAMGDLLKKTGAANLFMIFGEPDIEVRPHSSHSSHSPPIPSPSQLEVEIKGLDVYDPTTGEVRSSSTDDIACWFIDTNYNGESFFVRHAYFTGAASKEEGGPYDKLKRALRAEVDEAAWSALYSTTSRPFPAPQNGKIAVKVINHYGDEVLKVFAVRT